jgi:hypothetical protein
MTKENFVVSLFYKKQTPTVSLLSKGHSHEKKFAK